MQRSPSPRGNRAIPDVMQVKGAILKARIKYAKDKGDDAWLRLLASVPESTSAVLQAPILTQKWYPFEVLDHVNVALDRMFGRGDMQLCIELGAHACNTNFTTIYRAFFRMLNFHFLIRRASQAWTLQYDAGEMLIPEREEQSALVQIRNIPQPNKGQCLAVIGWAIRASELTGCKNASYVIERCRRRGDDVCQWRFHWE